MKKIIAFLCLLPLMLLGQSISSSTRAVYKSNVPAYKDYILEDIKIGPSRTVTVLSGGNFTVGAGGTVTFDPSAIVVGLPGGAPSGAAGGVLGGTYPSPTFAVDMATQAELDAVASAKADAAATTAALATKADTASLAAVATSGSAADLTGTLNAAQTPAYTGDVSKAAGSNNIVLAATGVTPGTYGNSSNAVTVQVDAAGRIVSIANAAISGGAGNVTAADDLSNFIPYGSSPAGLSKTGVRWFPGNTTLSITGDMNVSGNISAAGGLGGALAENQILIGNVTSGGFEKRIFAQGANVTVTKNATHFIVDADLSGVSGATPPGATIWWDTTDLANKPAGFFNSGEYGTASGAVSGGLSPITYARGTVANPTVDIPGGAVPVNTVVTITPATAGSFFTALNNGTDPTYTLGDVGSTFTVTANQTWKFRANKQGWFSSAVQSETYTIDPIPTLSSAVLQASGTDIVLGWPENVSYGAGGTGGYALTASGGAVSVTGVTGGGTTSHTLTTNRTITNAESVTLDYTNPGNGAEDSAGQDVTVTGFTVNTSGGPAGGGGVPTPDLLHWPLNDAAGTTITAAVGPGATGITGTLNGDYLAMVDANGVFSSGTSVTWGTNVVTVSLWVRRPNWSTAAYVFRSCEFNVLPRFEVFLDGGWTTLNNNGATGAVAKRSYGLIATGTWTHIAAVFDGSTGSGSVKLFINGTEHTSWGETLADDRTGTGNFAADKATIKNPFNPAGDFDLDDLRVYTGELSGAQISAIYAAGRP